MRSVLITGAASGIGAGLAGDLARHGEHIILADLRRVDVEAAAKVISASGGSVEPLVMDVTSDASVAAAIASLSRPVDVLINNAGLQRVSPLEEFPMDRWSYLVEVMLIGAARLMRALIGGMRVRGYGRIVNIGSIHSVVASPFKSAYVAAKHGLLGLSKTIALETADTDITVNTICPSYVRTPLVDKQIVDQARARNIPESLVVEDVMLAPMPKKMFVTVEEISGIVLFLASPCARNITGQTIVVDGGWTAQ